MVILQLAVVIGGRYDTNHMLFPYNFVPDNEGIFESNYLLTFRLLDSVDVDTGVGICFT